MDESSFRFGLRLGSIGSNRFRWAFDQHRSHILWEGIILGHQFCCCFSRESNAEIGPSIGSIILIFCQLAIALDLS
ncbi:MAG: hypothetical protein BJG00_008305 [Limnothrix sp. CACIAM 69d]|nr:MAG: hypothetical protein BJG00_008305 [Limnothrix sp. CACIAM 69d]